MIFDKDYCDYETCVALSKLGCPVPKYTTINIHTKEKEWKMWISLYNAQKWLREEKGILLQPTYLELSDEWICVIRDKNKRHGYSAQKQKNYEEALSEGIKEAVKLLINNKNE
jgi:hypothetical protein